MNENRINVTKPFLPDYEEYCDEIKTIWENTVLTNGGDKHRKFEKELAKYLGVNEISLFSNGHMALELAIAAFGLKGECITTPFTHCSTTHSIVRNGLEPVFCDVKEDDFTIDPEKIEDLITDKTSAIVATHIYGFPCAVEQIERIAANHDLKVIYDGAHAFGVIVDGKGIAEYGDATMFSMHATKVFHSVEGGAVSFRDREKHIKAEELLNFGYADSEIVVDIGVNARMNEFQAAMGICNLRHFESELRERKERYDLYRSCLSEIQGIYIPEPGKNVVLNYAYFPVFFFDYKKSRDQVLFELRKHNIYARKYFYPLVTDMPCYKHLYSSMSTPVSKRSADAVLALPLYRELDFSDIERICEIIISDVL